MKNRVLPFLMVAFAGGFSVTTQAQSVFYTSPNGVQEECRKIAHFPGGDYSDGDLKDEESLCGVDFYNDPTVAICPKTWSTSPGTMIYDISKSGLTQKQYEDSPQCAEKKGHEKISKFKQSMNQKGTSGTFSQSNLLYYHLSRYFDSAVAVPVFVYRSMDRAAHFERVTKKAHTQKLGKGEQIRKGWEWLYLAEQNPRVYEPPRNLFTPDLNQIYGVIGDAGGERYGTEISGIRSKWGDRQNEEFQQTPAFYALRSEKDLLPAIAEGIALGTKNGQIKKDLGPISELQMAIWMKEISEIVILDYILNQQDRIGNIDFKWYAYWVDVEGKVQSEKLDTEVQRSAMAGIDYPEQKDGSPVFLIQRTRINDNDAGVKSIYTNFTKRTKMLEKIRHMDRKTYDRLMALDADLQNKGPIYQQIANDFYLFEGDVKKLVTQTREAAAILEATERAGLMKFDLTSVKKMVGQFGN